MRHDRYSGRGKLRQSSLDVIHKSFNLYPFGHKLLSGVRQMNVEGHNKEFKLRASLVFFLIPIVK